MTDIRLTEYRDTPWDQDVFLRQLALGEQINDTLRICAQLVQANIGASNAVRIASFVEEERQRLSSIHQNLMKEFEKPEGKEENE